LRGGRGGTGKGLDAWGLSREKKKWRQSKKEGR
jgi:hypothetical protein